MSVVCDTANVRVFKQITTLCQLYIRQRMLFAILQMYEFSSKSQLLCNMIPVVLSCLRYCKCTSFQANHNICLVIILRCVVVCDTANVRVFKQITTKKVDPTDYVCCLRYCKCTSFQANHNLYVELLDRYELFAILQMYEFSSKSQLPLIIMALN